MEDADRVCLLNRAHRLFNTRRVDDLVDMMTEDVEWIEHNLDSYTEALPDSWLINTTARTLQRKWSDARLKVGRPDLRLHDLRHTGLTLAAATGATMAELMHRAGHASPAAALRYQHATENRDRVLANALVALVTPAEVTSIGRRNGSAMGDEGPSADTGIVEV